MARSVWATSIWPRWPRRAWMRGSNGASEPSRASTDRPPAASAAAKIASARKRPAMAVAVENWVPFNSASPSFGPSVMGLRPARFRPSTADRVSPLCRVSPTPSSTDDM